MECVYVGLTILAVVLALAFASERGGQGQSEDCLLGGSAVPHWRDPNNPDVCERRPYVILNRREPSI